MIVFEARKRYALAAKSQRQLNRIESFLVDYSKHLVVRTEYTHTGFQIRTPELEPKRRQQDKREEKKKTVLRCFFLHMSVYSSNRLHRYTHTNARTHSHTHAHHGKCKHTIQAEKQTETNAKKKKKKRKI